MFNAAKILTDGAIYSLAASLYLMITLAVNPRLFLQDYPQDVRDAVPPKSKREQQLSLWVGIPFLLLLLLGPVLSTWDLVRSGAGAVTLPMACLHAFGIVFIFNLVDLLILDWLLFCTLTPRFMVVPGTQGLAGYKDYGHHWVAALKGTALSLVAGLIVGTAVYFLVG
jgi:hypothetical protein